MVFDHISELVLKISEKQLTPSHAQCRDSLEQSHSKHVRLART